MNIREPRILTVPVPVAYWRFAGQRPDDWFKPDVATFYGERPRTVLKETIVSDDGPSRGVKFCFHKKWTQVGNSLRLTGRDGWGFEVGIDVFVDFDPEPFIMAAWLEQWNPYGVDWDRVFNQYIPPMRNDFNIINFAWEAGELRDMAQSFRSSISDRESLFRRAGFVQSGTSGWHFSPSEVADSYLEGTFGYQPLASDLSTIRDLVANYGNTLGRTRARLRRGSNLKVKRPISVSKTTPTTVRDRWGNTLSCNVHITAQGEECVGCRVKGDLPVDPVREYLDYIGFYPDLSTLWNMLPFSFLIDYVVPIGDALEGDPWMVPRVDFSMGCYSVNIRGNWAVEITSNQYPGLIPDPGVPTPDMLVTQGTFNVYSREPVSPVLDGVDLPNISAPRLRQQANIAALVSSFRR